MERSIKKGDSGQGMRLVDWVALERSDLRHWVLEKAIVDLFAARKIKPLTNQHIDLLVHCGPVSIVFEVKSSTPDEGGRRVRQGIYQLLEYRFLYRENLGSDVRLCIVAEHRPMGGDYWLLEYTEHLRIGLIWKKNDSDALACTEFTKKLLVDVLPQLAEWS
jgi:hypothetical protein